jgi:hypothetical protein
MDVVWIALGVILMLAGLAGCALPFLPGPPLCYLALLLQQLKELAPFNTKFLWIWAGITIVITLLDYIIPVFGTKKYGGSKFGVWGCMIGLVFGLFFGPLGIIIGPFVGAFVGELLAKSDSNLALRAAWGSFVGFLMGTLLKLIACFVMIYYFIRSFGVTDISY